MTPQLLTLCTEIARLVGRVEALIDGKRVLGDSKEIREVQNATASGDNTINHRYCYCC